MLTNTTKVTHNLIIRNANDGQAIAFQKSRTLRIFPCVYIFIMLRAIQFNYQFGFRTIKICNVFSKNLLSRKADWIGTQKIIPKMPFFFCHFFSQLFCKRN